MANKSGRVTFGVPKSGGIPRPSSGYGRPTASSTRISQASTSSTTVFQPPASSTKVGKAPKKPAFTIPALSIPPKVPPLDPVLERLRKKTIRRNAPEGEDLPRIREIIRGINKEVVTVQEFVGLVSSYTGDNGNILRAVMADDLSSFRKMAKRVYDTMTQDVSDVLTNEQIYLMDFYNEKHNTFTDKMMRAINEIYRYVPDFDFERYYNDPEYLNKLFPLTADLETDPEELQMQRRQEAYHRLQWLRSEGVRLNEENSKLQGRLKDLKREQQNEIEDARKREELADAHNIQLAATQADLQDQLKELNESVEKSIITTEEDHRLTEDSQLLAKKSTARSVKAARSRPQIKRTGEPWNVKAARVIEENTFVESAQEAVSSVSMVSIAPKTGAVKKKIKSKIKRPPRRQQEETSPFHYSPPRPKSPKQLSPFHYSPTKTPPQQAFQYSPPRSTARGGVPETVRVESSTTIVEQAPRSRQLPAARRSLAPRDSWSGF